MNYLTQCEVPEGIERRFYSGFFVHHAETCLNAGYEDNAASWMHRDQGEIDSDFSPVAGTLHVARRHGVDGILYVDARDVARELSHVGGGGI